MYYKNRIKSNEKIFSLTKIFLITVGILLIIMLVAIMLGSQYYEKTYTIELKGDTSVVVYKGSNYEDPGAKAYDDKNADLSSQISVDSNLNINKKGRYEIIYKIGDISVKRVVRVIENPNINLSDVNPGNINESAENVVVKNGETTLTLKGKETVYIDVYGNYTEEGYSAIDVVDGNITKKVKVTHNVDNTKPGTYQVVYTVKNSSGITTSIKRNIVVMKVEMMLDLVNKNYTNSSVGIKVTVVDDYFDYLVLPNSKIVSSKNYVYDVEQNGDYEFVSYNKYGAVRSLKITVSNIDKTAPTASCSAEYKDGKTIVKIDSKDNVGIGRYVVNDKKYFSSTVVQDSLITNNNIVVYDLAGNYTNTSCVVVPKVSINNIKQNGVIITVEADKVNSDIAGYYFSYSSNRNDGGFIATSLDSIDVVRLPGTTYVWVEDTSGNISEAKKISISNDVLLITSGNNYTTLKNMALEDYLIKNGWSKEQFDKLIARSVRAAGIYSKDAAATAGVALQIVLAQKYKIKLPYWWGGKSWEYGTNKDWGTYRTKYSKEYDKWYYYYGFDCTGFVTWAYVNAGYDINKGQYPSYASYKTYSIAKENGDVGDFIVQPGHVKMIVGKTSTGFICAEASAGVSLSTHSYSKKNNFYIAKGENIGDRYPKDSLSNIPSGF